MKQYRISTIMIPKESFTDGEAMDWIVENFKFKNVSENKHFYIFRQNTPSYLKSKGFTDYRSKELPNKVIVVMAYHQSLDGGEVSVEELNKFVDAGYNDNREGNIDGFILDKSLSTNENQIYHNPSSNQTVVNLRGTEGTLRDWGNNVYGALGLYHKTDRYKRAEKVKNEAIQKYGKDISVVSHSQGAFSGHEFSKDTNVKEVIHFNPAPTGKLNKNEHVVRSGVDLVCLPTTLRNLGNKQITTILPKIPSFNPRKLAKYMINEHSTNILNRLNPLNKIGG